MTHTFRIYSNVSRHATKTFLRIGKIFSSRTRSESREISTFYNTINLVKMSDFVQVNVSNSMNEYVSFEKKFTKDLSIADLKAKLEIITGGSSGSMQIHLYSGDRLVAQLDNNDAEIGSYPIENGMRLHVIDKNTITLNEQVEKFELTERDYDQRRNTVRDYLKSNKLGKYNEEEMAALEAKRQEEAREQEELASKIEIGNRCLVTAKGPRRIGTVMYKGPLDGKAGIFIGVKFDEPLGIHNGSVNGKEYFVCPPKYGSMVPVGAVEVGDFPPENDFSDDEL